MPDTRVGSLDNPQRYGCRSVAVYENSTGYYYKLDGCREKVHGNQRWTSTSQVKMRGSSLVESAGALAECSGDDSDNEEDRQQLAAAIAASLLQDDGPAWDDHMPMDVEPAEDAPSAGAGTGGAGDTASVSPGPSGASRDCTICLTVPSVMLNRPCNHICACQTCSRRLVRHPCPLCRRIITKIERVYF